MGFSARQHRVDKAPKCVVVFEGKVFKIPSLYIPPEIQIQLRHHSSSTNHFDFNHELTSRPISNYLQEKYLSLDIYRRAIIIFLKHLERDPAKHPSNEITKYLEHCPRGYDISARSRSTSIRTPALERFWCLAIVCGRYDGGKWCYPSMASFFSTHATELIKNSAFECIFYAQAIMDAEFGRTETYPLLKVLIDASPSLKRQYELGQRTLIALQEVQMERRLSALSSSHATPRHLVSQPKSIPMIESKDKRSIVKVKPGEQIVIEGSSPPHQSGPSRDNRHHHHRHDSDFANYSYNTIRPSDYVSSFPDALIPPRKPPLASRHTYSGMDHACISDSDSSNYHSYRSSPRATPRFLRSLSNASIDALVGGRSSRSLYPYKDHLAPSLGRHL
ncbi:MAG: hypothetical protein M1829_000807 [Trizodia sp. TS-e1964]|nr:MAG: hypothetical protein M1829_000807 [Trizodia sp. TS-e1964]